MLEFINLDDAPIARRPYPGELENSNRVINCPLCSLGIPKTTPRYQLPLWLLNADGSKTRISLDCDQKTRDHIVKVCENERTRIFEGTAGSETESEGETAVS